MEMSNKTYDILKYVAQIALPALTTCWLAIAAIWELPLAEQIGGTMAAVDALLGALLRVSANKYDKKED